MIITGNAVEDGVDYRGWFLGHFFSAPDPRSTSAVEVKWGCHAAGERRSAALCLEATTLAILLRGRFRYCFPGREVLLASQGDYLLWPAGVPHAWVAEEDSEVLTVRWPSKPGDTVELAS